jgi:hypothetical protein
LRVKRLRPLDDGGKSQSFWYITIIGYTNTLK